MRQLVNRRLGRRRPQGSRSCVCSAALPAAASAVRCFSIFPFFGPGILRIAIDWGYRYTCTCTLRIRLYNGTTLP
jgi:hypothetical protein